MYQGIAAWPANAFSVVSDAVAVQACFQDISRSVKEASLKFGSLWFAQISFRTSSAHVCNVLEAATTFSEPLIALTNVAVLQSLVEICEQAVSPISFQPSLDFLAKYAVGVMMRLQHSCSVVDEDMSDKVVRQTAKATQVVLTAAIDLLALCCISLYAIEGLVHGRVFDMPSCRGNPSVVLYLSSDSLDISALSKTMEQELLKRIRSLSFPSLTQESTFEVTMRLLDRLENPCDNGEGKDDAPLSTFTDDTQDSGSITSPVLSPTRLLQLPKYRSKSSDMSQRLGIPADEENLAMLHSTTTSTLIELFNNATTVLMDSNIKPDMISPRAAPPPTLRSATFDRQKLRALKETNARPNSYTSGITSAMLGEGSGKYDSIELSPMVSQIIPARRPSQTAAGIAMHTDALHQPRQSDGFASSLTSQDSLRSSLPYDPFKASLDSTLSSSLESIGSSSNDNYTRAASARVKRSRLKNIHQPVHAPAHIEPLQYPSDVEASYSDFEGKPRSGLSIATPLAENEEEMDSHSQSTSSRTPIAIKQSLMSPNARNREVRSGGTAFTPSKFKPVSLARQSSDDETNVTGHSLDYDQSLHSNDSMATHSAQATPLPTLAKSDAFEYTISADLMPLQHPSADFNAAMHGLEVHEWPNIFHTLNNIRRAVLHHPQLILQSGCLHTLLQLVLKHALNLRSALAKNALLTIADCFQGLKKAMDVEASLVVPVVLKRSADSSNFLGESADQALLLMIDNINPLRSFAALLLMVDHKNAAIRSKTSFMLAVLLKQHPGDLAMSKDLDQLKGKLMKMLQDASPETRSNSREIVRLLLGPLRGSRPELEGYVGADLVEKSLKEPLGSNSSHYNLRNISDGEASASNSRPSSHLPRISKYRTNGTATPPRNGKMSADDESPLPFVGTPGCSVYDDDSEDYMASPQRTGHRPAHSATPGRIGTTSATATPTKQMGRNVISASQGPRDSAAHSAANSSFAAKRMMENDPELILWSELQIKISTTKALQGKKDAMSAFTDLIAKHHTVLRDAGKLDASLDSLLDRLEDGSIKIIQHAMDCCERLQQTDAVILQSGGPQIVSPKLLGAVGSSNK